MTDDFYKGIYNGILAAVLALFIASYMGYIEFKRPGQTAPPIVDSGTTTPDPGAAEGKSIFEDPERFPELVAYVKANREDFIAAGVALEKVRRVTITKWDTLQLPAIITPVEVDTAAIRRGYVKAPNIGPALDSTLILMGTGFRYFKTPFPAINGDHYRLELTGYGLTPTDKIDHTLTIDTQGIIDDSKPSRVLVWLGRFGLFTTGILAGRGTE